MIQLCPQCTINSPRRRKLSDKLLDCWIDYLQCRLAILSHGEDVQFFDAGDIAAREVRQTEQQMRTYKIRNPRTVWNKLHIVYNALEAEYREKDMSRTADALHYFAMMARMKLYFWQAMRGGKGKFWSVRQFLALLATRMVTGFGRSVWRPVLVLVPLPILACALVYWASKGLLLNGNLLQGTDLDKFWYSLCFSTFTFTGAGPGDLTPTDSMLVHVVAAAEVVVGYVITVVALGYLLNQLSSWGASGKQAKGSAAQEKDSG